MIVFDRVSKRYSRAQEALSQVSFQLDSGEMAFLTGHSGAGKSTLLKLIALVERSSQGNIFLDNINYQRVRHNEVPFVRRRMGLIFQNPYLLNDRSVFDNVAMPLNIIGMRPADISRRVRAALDKVDLLKQEKVTPDRLSSGEQQRVSIARAIVHKPHLLLADEPTGNLDPDLSTDIYRLFAAFNQVGVTVLIATHDLSLVANMPYRLMTLNQGRLLC